MRKVPFLLHFFSFIPIVGDRNPPVHSHDAALIAVTGLTLGKIGVILPGLRNHAGNIAALFLHILLLVRAGNSRLRTASSAFPLSGAGLRTDADTLPRFTAGLRTAADALPRFTAGTRTAADTLPRLTAGIRTAADAFSRFTAGSPLRAAAPAIPTAVSTSAEQQQQNNPVHMLTIICFMVSYAAPPDPVRLLPVQNLRPHRWKICAYLRRPLLTSSLLMQAKVFSSPSSASIRSIRSSTAAVSS